MAQFPKTLSLISLQHLNTSVPLLAQLICLCYSKMSMALRGAQTGDATERQLMPENRRTIRIARRVARRCIKEREATLKKYLLFRYGSKTTRVSHFQDRPTRTNCRSYEL